MNLEEELEELSRLRSAGATLRNGVCQLASEVNGLAVPENESPDQIAEWLVNKCLGLMEELEELKHEKEGPFAVGTPVIASIKCEGSKSSQGDYYQMRTRVSEAPSLDKRGSLVLKVDGYSDHISVGLIRVDLAQQRKESNECHGGSAFLGLAIASDSSR
jgi:hypothetical protein